MLLESSMSSRKRWEQENQKYVLTGKCIRKPHVYYYLYVVSESVI